MTALRRPTLVALSCAALLALTGCTKAPPSSLSDTSWSVQLIAGTPILSGANISLTFTDSRYFGVTQSLHYEGLITVSGNHVTLGGMTATPIAIGDKPPGFRQQASNYFALLRNAETYGIDGNRLTITCGNGETLVLSRE